MIPFILLGHPDSLTEHPCDLGIPVPRIEVGAGRIEDGGKRKPTEAVLRDLLSEGANTS